MPACDGQTDGQTDVQPISITCFSIADARKNHSAVQYGIRKGSPMEGVRVYGEKACVNVLKVQLLPRSSFAVSIAARSKQLQVMGTEVYSANVYCRQ